MQPVVVTTALPVCAFASLFTGKERDSESGLDYFGARYYASSMGRWMSPDWNSDPRPVPYANFENPQTLNLYAYVVNNPLSKRDADGHTHQECGAQTTSTDPKTGATNVNANCHDVPDWWNVWTNLKNWRNNVRDTMDRNAIKHQPVRMGNENGDQALEDLNNIMMGLEPVGTAKSPGNMQRQVEKGQAPKS